MKPPAEVCALPLVPGQVVAVTGFHDDLHDDDDGDNDLHDYEDNIYR